MRVVLGLGAVAVAATVLTACGNSNGGSTTAAGTAPSAASSAASGQQDMSGYGSGAAATGAGTTVTVDETEFSLGLSTTTFSPGTYTFKVKDSGHATHNLVIEGPGVEEQKSSAVSPGEATTLTVTLQKGTYELYCAIANHKSLGMQTKITVG